ncbi:MAG TPA: cytochrome b N-terminal domain-containing protein [Gaiellales bacterium]|nr:cytochrome b N-terminal domain-containing protein [Gaiellales bacterium]
MIERTTRTLDERSHTAPFGFKALRYIFPDHWSFLLGEIALYCFIVLVATGTYLALFFDPSTAQTVYHGSYAPLNGAHMTEAYRSTVRLSLDVKAGLLIRQTHHWAADVFVAAIALHLMRIVFTGAFRKPRELTYYIGLTILGLALLEGYLGYSLVDDLLSGMGLAIGYGVALSIPLVGANLAALVWGGPFPGDPAFWSRMYIAHVFLLPILIATLIALHLFLVSSLHHTQFRGGRKTEKRLVGVPSFPGQAPRSLGLMFAVFAALFLLGGLVQINPIWIWGPYHVADSTNGAQPDWYLGWLIGALRLMPSFDVVIAGRTLVPNPFWGGALLPTAVFGGLFVWPALERRFTRDRHPHNLLDRPRDAPRRTAFATAVLTFLFIVFVAGSADRAYVLMGWSYATQIDVYRVGVFVVPVVSYWLAHRICVELLRNERVEASRHAAELEAEQAAGGG